MTSPDPEPSSRRLRLRLQPSALLPNSMSWMILEGYVRVISWDQEGEAITLALWGPGDWVSHQGSNLSLVEIQCLSHVEVEQYEPSPDDWLRLLRQQLSNTEQIYEINRIRSAETRLLALLRWLSQRFGHVSSQGHRLSLKEMNLTHRGLADICGLTRVTVTKNLNRYKALGWVRSIGETDLLIPPAATGDP